MHLIRDIGPEGNYTAVKPESADTGTTQQSPSHGPQKLFLAPVAFAGWQFQDFTILKGRNHPISSLNLFRAKFMPTCSYANIALGLK